MRWIPGGYTQAAQAGSCKIPTGSDHQKLSFAVSDTNHADTAFEHPPLQKHDLLPTFATTRVAKQLNAARPAPEGQKSDQVAASTFGQTRQPQNVRRISTFEAPKTAKTVEQQTLKRANRARKGVTAPLTFEPHTPPPGHKARNIGKKRNIPKKSARLLSQSKSARPHHTPPLRRAEIASVPSPQAKPANTPVQPAKIGTVSLPASVIEPAGERSGQTQPRTTATTGFAVGQVVTRASSKALINSSLDEKAPIFRRKPAKNVHPTNESHCLSLALYYEARDESTEAQIGLAKVIMSRVKSKRYPNTICGVVYQNAHLRGRCAFSFACDGLSEEPKNSITWSRSRALALKSVCGNTCSKLTRVSHSVQKGKPDNVRSPARRPSKHRQITDSGMKHMGRDGVNAFAPTARPLF